MPGDSAIRGYAIGFRGDPFFDDDALVDVEDALIVSEGGSIAAFGPFAEIVDSVPDGTEVRRYPDAPICAGFIDTTSTTSRPRSSAPSDRS